MAALLRRLMRVSSTRIAQPVSVNKITLGKRQDSCVKHSVIYVLIITLLYNVQPVTATKVQK